MAEITVKSLREILIDGKSAGSAFDVVRNHPEVSSDLQRALEAHADVTLSKHEASLKAKDAEIAECKADLTAKIAALEAVTVEKENMEAHPVVQAKRKAELIAKAHADDAMADQMKIEAARVLAELGEE